MLQSDIFKASKNDLVEILALQKLAYQSEAILYNDFTIPPLTQTLSEIENEFDKSLFFKAVFEGKIIGSVRVNIDNNICKIGKLIVDPHMQRQGIGSSLMHHVEKTFSHIGHFELFTGAKSLHNIQLYEKLGYSIFKHATLSPNISIIFLEKKS